MLQVCTNWQEFPGDTDCFLKIYFKKKAESHSGTQARPTQPARNNNCVNDSERTKFAKGTNVAAVVFFLIQWLLFEKFGDSKTCFSPENINPELNCFHRS